MLEVFNTLLKHLRMSVDFELGDGSRRNSGTSISSSRGKENEERIVQNAIIQTIGKLTDDVTDTVTVPTVRLKSSLSKHDFQAG